MSFDGGIRCGESVGSRGHGGICLEYVALPRRMVIVVGELRLPIRVSDLLENPSDAWRGSLLIQGMWLHKSRGAIIGTRSSFMKYRHPPGETYHATQISGVRDTGVRSDGDEKRFAPCRWTEPS